MTIFLAPYAIFSSSYYHPSNLVSSKEILHLSDSKKDNVSTGYQLDFFMAAQEIDFSSIAIQKVSLELPIHKVTYSQPFIYNELTIWCANDSNILHSPSTYMPPTAPSMTFPLTSDLLEGDLFSIDLTSLVLSCPIETLSLCHLFIQLNMPGLNIYFCNHNCLNSPKVLLEYIQKPQTASSGSLSLLYTAVNQTRCVIAHDAPLPFDQIDSDDTVVHYDQETGTFIFLRPGCYLFHWILNIQGTTSLTCLNIGLLNVTTHQLLSFNSACVLPNQVQGQQIIHISTPPEKYALINASKGDIQFSHLPLQASLIISKL